MTDGTWKPPANDFYRPSSRAVWAGDRYEVQVYEVHGKVVVQIDPLGPVTYALGGPFYRSCDPRPRVWWKPWTWFRRDVDAAVEAAIRKAKRMERRDARGERAATAHRVVERIRRGLE